MQARDIRTEYKYLYGTDSIERQDELSLNNVHKR